LLIQSLLLLLVSGIILAICQIVKVLQVSLQPLKLVQHMLLAVPLWGLQEALLSVLLPAILVWVQGWVQRLVALVAPHRVVFLVWINSSLSLKIV
jgi:hypothetical protein